MKAFFVLDTSQTMPLSKKIRVSSGGIHGRCWFAAEDISAGELLWWAPTEPHPSEIFVTVAELESWPEEKRNKFMELAYQIDAEHMAGFPEDCSDIPPEYVAENFVNHTCDGNAWYEGKDRLVALRDIKKDAEIAYDYALTEAHPIFRLNCLCGAAACRGVITGDDWKKPELQEKYGEHFMPHINDLIKALKASQAN